MQFMQIGSDAVVRAFQQLQEIGGKGRNQVWRQVADLIQHLDAVILNIRVLIAQVTGNFPDPFPVLMLNQFPGKFLVGDFVAPSLQTVAIRLIRHRNKPPGISDRFKQVKIACLEAPNSGAAGTGNVLAAQSLVNARRHPSLPTQRNKPARPPPSIPQTASGPSFPPAREGVAGQQRAGGLADAPDG